MEEGKQNGNHKMDKEQDYFNFEFGDFSKIINLNFDFSSVFGKQPYLNYGN